jgi:hypothetical protein
LQPHRHAPASMCLASTTSAGPLLNVCKTPLPRLTRRSRLPSPPLPTRPQCSWIAWSSICCAQRPSRLRLRLCQPPGSWPWAHVHTRADVP